MSRVDVWVNCSFNSGRDKDLVNVRSLKVSWNDVWGTQPLVRSVGLCSDRWSLTCKHSCHTAVLSQHAEGETARLREEERLNQTEASRVSLRKLHICRETSALN